MLDSEELKFSLHYARKSKSAALKVQACNTQYHTHTHRAERLLKIRQKHSLLQKSAYYVDDD